MRQEATPAEARLWEALRGRQVAGLKFRRQYPLGPFVLDFCCPAQRLVVELDGSAHDDPEQISRDAVRSQHLLTHGYRVIRFRNEEVFDNLDAVIEQIHRAALAVPDAPPASTAEGAEP
jgi:very-short-patch-repair endonuclease